ncbi:hypothetical protein MTR_3g436230 [Medicago truncatula]|uniref:Uncharacterized protein n=1 Tax=Medicago truncatula TaxID=3880 RepID=A0A072UU60_MEDTR|nr:hypothetical protein MTR_3g436230 [Medicago truncatula]
MASSTVRNGELRGATREARENFSRGEDHRSRGRAMNVGSGKSAEHWKALIKENKTYTLYNCHALDNDIAFNPFKVVFSFGTKMQKYDKLTNVLTHEFRFKSFKKIQDGKFKTDFLYEIIGLLHEIVKTPPIGTRKKPCTNIVLKDKRFEDAHQPTSSGC